MKVLHVLDVSWPIQRGYSIRGYYITKHQKDDGIEPTVLTSERQYEQNYDACHEGVKYFRSERKIEPFSKISVLREVLQIGRLRNKILGIAKAENIDLIHAHSPSLWGLAALLARAKLRRKVVYEIRAFWEDAAVDAGKIREGGFSYKLRRALETAVVRRADKVVVICQGLRKDLISRGIPEEKIVVVPNGVDTENFAPIKKNVDLIEQYGLEGKIVFGFVGSMFNFEGLELLVEAVAGLEKKTKGKIRVLLVGEGESYGRIKAMIWDEKLSETILLIGKVPHEQVKEFYSIIDVFVYPRIRRRITELVTPLKPLEAMAMGKAVIMSDVGGLVELLDNEECGMVFEAGNTQSLAKVMSELAAEPSKIEILGKSALETVRRDRSWKDLIHIYKTRVYGIV